MPLVLSQGALVESFTSMLRGSFSAFLLSLLLLLSVLAGCNDSRIAVEDPTGVEVETSIIERSDRPESPRIYGPLDRHYVEIARENPGFGGLYFDDQGRMVLRTKSGTVPPALTRLGAPGVSKVAITADFSFLELAQWYGPFVDAIALVEWYWTDIDERRNRLTAGVASLNNAKSVLEAAGVPANVYNLEKATAGHPIKTIRDKFRPVPGGVETRQFGADVGCTVGVNVDHWQFGDTFLIASHCTNLMADFDGASFYQPTSQVDPTRIGQEVFDQMPFSSATCPTTYCRYSDAALIGYDEASDAEYGHIVRTFQNSKSKTVDPSNPRHVIAGENREGIGDGTTIIQIGVSDGWSRGDVNKTCANRPSLRRSDLTLLCQYRSSEGAQKGDSGGPVFVPSPSVDSVTFVGILIQKDGQTFELDTDSWFSPLSGIVREAKPDSSLFCDGLFLRADEGCGSFFNTGGSGEGDDECGPQSVQECS